eukprot:10190682-Karenia_brevis.AAC.1
MPSLSSMLLEEGDHDQGILSNDDWNVKLSRAAPSPNDKMILQLTDKEIVKGKAKGYFTKSEVDSMFGRGSWRANKRFLLWQENHNKHRAIDNCKTSLENEAAQIWESIATPPVDMTMRVIARLATIKGQKLETLPQL